MVTAISVEGVSKHFGSVAALDGIDLDVAEGSILGLVGANGVGKTTLIRILVGVLGADSGSVRVLGHDPAAQRGILRPQIGYMPQAAVLYQDLTVAENVSFFAKGHDLEHVRERVAAVLTFVDLDDAIDRPVSTLSGGQAQRASLAAAMVHEPRLLFLDEPTAGVDPELRHAFWVRFRNLAESGVTVIVSTHQMDEVARCDRVALMRSGKVLASAAPDALFHSSGATIRVSRHGSIHEYHVGAASTGLPAILRDMGLDPAVSSIEVRANSLEDVILAMIDREGGSAS